MNTSARVATLEAIRRLPKIELHVHLEGAIGTHRIVDMAARSGQPLKRPVAGLFRTRTLDEFLANLDWVCSLVTTEQMARELALDFARYASSEGIVYAEVIVNPTHWKGLPPEQLLAAICAGFDAAQRDGACDVRLLPSVLRQQSLAEAMRLVDIMASLREPRILGLSVDGNQARAVDSSERLAPAFARAAALGFARTVHAGESSGPDGVAAAIDALGAQRIDHGVRAIEDAALVARLAQNHITLNVCLSSNCHLLYPDIDAHPLRQLLDAGVNCTLNTDDPVVLGTTLCQELHWAATALDWDMRVLAGFQRNAVAAAFCSGAEKTSLGQLLDAYGESVDE